jgi:hypothetical protein
VPFPSTRSAADTTDRNRQHVRVDVVEEMRSAIESRLDGWTHVGVRVEIVRHTPSTSLLARGTSDTALADLVIWSTGEADLIWAVIAKGGDPATDHYEISSALGVEGMLDDLDGRLRRP